VRTVESFPLSDVRLYHSSFHPDGSEGGSDGGYGTGAAGGGPDKIGRNSGGMKLIQTS